jgi:NTE family protein
MNRSLVRPFVSILGILLALLPAACGGAAPAAGTTASAGAVATPANPSGASPAARRALVLGGGGPTGRAFEIGILKGLRDAGVDLTKADLIVGTSAGAVLGAQIRADEPVDSLYSALLEAGDGPPSQPSDPGFDPAYFQQTVQMINGASAVTPALRIAVGRRALAAPKAMSEDAQLRFIAAALGGAIHEWPSRPLKIAAGDVTEGTIRFFDRTQGVPIERALMASTAVPGRVVPIAIGDRSYVDGFVGGPCPGGCWPNLDGADGYGIIVVVASGSGPQLTEQVEQMRAKGSWVILVSPDAESVAARGQDPFDLGHLKPAAEAGLRQVGAVSAAVRNVWSAGAPGAH